MHNLLGVSMPFEDPALVLVTVFAVVLFAPVLAGLARIPPIIGLIAGGILVGPNGLELVERVGTIELLGGAGLLFLMFQAGIELDLDDFAAHRNGAVIFGLATFLLPMAIGTVGHLLLGFDAMAAVLLASCWASHTLLSYPTFQRLGVVTNRSVSTAVGATIITDIAALMVLVVVIAADGGDLDVAFFAGLLPALAAAFAFILLVLPRLARWFFKRAGRDRISRFLFVCLALYGSAAIAEVAGTEAIIGAFLAGLALNRLIPHGGLLMERIDFFGGTFLVPIFLISVGMLVDLGALADAETLGWAAGFCAVVVGAKLAAAALAGRVLHFGSAEVGSMFSLSVAQAAATLAAVFVGLEAGIIDGRAVNAVVVVILVTSLLSSLGAARYGAQLPVPPMKELTLGQRILVGLPEQGDPSAMVDLASRLAAPESGSVLPARILDLESQPADVQAKRAAIVETLEPRILGSGAEVTPIIRLDLTPNAGLLHATIEQQATCLLLGWRGYTARRDAILGEQLDALLALSPVPVMVHREGAESGIRRVVLAVDPGDLSPSGRRTLDLTLLVSARLATSYKVDWTVLTPADAPIIAEVESLDLHPEITVDARPLHVAVADVVGPSDLLVLGIPRALDGLGAGVARAARAVPGCRMLAVAAR
ncbi:MAG TPA: cation:proton antiporter [Acidimicrobiales bacterium]|nr:cation:proton antiporter [Acidimicrobiales bacterium]